MTSVELKYQNFFCSLFYNRNKYLQAVSSEKLSVAVVQEELHIKAGLLIVDLKQRLSTSVNKS